MTAITGSRSNIQIEETQYKSSVSEALMQKIGANINLIHDKNDEQDASISAIKSDFSFTAFYREAVGAGATNSYTVPSGYVLFLNYAYLESPASVGDSNYITTNFAGGGGWQGSATGVMGYSGGEPTGPVSTTNSIAVGYCLPAGSSVVLGVSGGHTHTAKYWGYLMRKP